MNDLIIPAPQTLLSLFSSLFTTIAEEMIRGLMKVSWERIDVNFKRSTQRFLAHNTIQVTFSFFCVQVKNYCINSDGKDVILHMVDNFLL
ncbi:hypothetical protein CK203_101538 [Vitis vinifera]|uniref:Uncharacterized protein n=1 Tax=Vitis vinifera TaxID=29760 RepID=A0A438F8Q7_VITVI|nr:hypothetical protein CK203_101538 [Vitis vinifera]